MNPCRVHGAERNAPQTLSDGAFRYAAHTLRNAHKSCRSAICKSEFNLGRDLLFLALQKKVVAWERV
jgi:hypothetical protein